jgi:hypothetical protein
MNTPFYVTYALLWALVVFQALILAAVIRLVFSLQQASARASGDEGLASGTPTPAFAAESLSGIVINSADFGGHATALLFVTPNCDSCLVTADELAALGGKTEGHTILICRGSYDECSGLQSHYAADVPIVVDPDYRISDTFNIRSVPTAILIDEANRIQSVGHPKRGDEHIEIPIDGKVHNVEEVAPA